MNKAYVIKNTWFYLALAVVFILFAEYTKKPLDPEGLKVKRDEGAFQHIAGFPFKERKGAKTYEFQFQYSGHQASEWNIIPDNKLVYIKVNGESVDLSEVSSKALKDYKKGFNISLGQYLTEKDNIVSVGVQNYGGPGALNIVSTGLGSGGWLTKLLSVVGFLLLCLPLILRLDSSTRWYLVTACILIAYYNTLIPFTDNDHDAIAHVQYINYLLQNIHPPAPFGAWEFHQPPVYYYLTAPLLLLGYGVDWIDGLELIQSLSSYAMVIFLFYSCRLFKLFFPEGGVRYFCCVLLLCLWPSMVIHSARLGNDVVYYAFTIISFYYICLWWKEERTRDFFVAAIFAAFAVTTKANGTILVATAGMLVLIRAVNQRSIDEMITLSLKAVPIIFVGLAISFGDSVYYMLAGDSENVLLGSSIKNLSKDLFVGNEPRNYLMFDVQTFVAEPYAYPWSDVGGRQYFWNYLLKTSLVSQFDFSRGYHENLSYALSVGYIVMLASIIAQMFRAGFSLENSPLLLFMFFSVLALLVFKVKAPASPHGDFRYIFPMLTCMFIYFAYGFKGRLSSWGNISRLVLVFFMAALSFLYSIRPVIA